MIDQSQDLDRHHAMLPNMPVLTQRRAGRPLIVDKPVRVH
jgi:hypothetical protein